VKLLNWFLACALTVACAPLALIEPPELVSRLSAKPAIFQVGPNVLYRSKHIPGAIYAGPGSKPEGLAMLRSAVADLPRDREIVLYCGCCPWDRCPNVQPAIHLLEEMGFKRAKVLHIPENFKTDWIDKGYPIE
jgi:thiosulfate/3-mercaptopyruvate sulfurtransferase